MTLHSRIAIVEDEPDLREAVAEYLGANGYEVIALDGAAAMRAAMAEAPVDLAILDISMPGEDGLSLGRWLRSSFQMGIIYATAAGTPIDKVVGLELGGDDYMVKPYELRELLARVRSVLRRVPREEQGRAERAAPEGGKARRSISFGGFSADLEGRILTGPDGATVEMAKSEFDVLEAFLTRSNRLVTRATLCEAIGLTDEPETSRAVDIRIMRLRRKIEADPANPQFLRTVRGEGYVFTVPDAQR